MKIAYFINQYPQVSQSFIRREILALERQGVEVCRYSARGWGIKLVDPQDIKEQQNTTYLLQSGIFSMIWAVLKMLCSRPKSFFKALSYALRFCISIGKIIPMPLAYLGEACQLYYFLRHQSIEHVHAHFGTNSTDVVMFLHILSGINYSFTVHGPEEFDKPISIHLKEKIQFAKFVVAISSYTRSQLYRWANYEDWPKIKIVRCGLEPAFYHGEPAPLPNNHRLVCVGRICEQKGQLLLVQAAEILVRQGLAFELVLAGDGDMRAEVERMINQFGLQQHVTITGWLSSAQVREHMLASRAMILPSFAEGLPVVIMEAMSLKRPVLSTYVAGIPELVHDGVTGFLFAAGDVQAIADAIKKFLEIPTAQLNQIVDNAYQSVVREHHIDQEAKVLQGYFDN